MPGRPRSWSEHQQQRRHRGQRHERQDHRPAPEPVRGRSPDKQARNQGQRVDQEQAGHRARTQPQLMPVDDEHGRELVGAHPTANIANAIVIQAFLGQVPVVVDMTLRAAA